MLAVDQDTRLLNYVVLGNARSGAAVVQSTLSRRPGAVCHAGLMHPDEGTRRAVHENYFGPSKDPVKLPEWFREGYVSPWQYINHTILDNPQKGEQAVGFLLTYPQVVRWDLYDLFEARCREGDFCVVHVVRNPVACFVSLKQAEKYGIWARSWDDAGPARCPSPVSLDPSELVDFCRNHEAVRGKIRAACSDVLEVPYRDLFLDYQAVMAKVFDFLELPDSEEPATAAYKRLRNRAMRQRISNWDKVVAAVPFDVKKLFDAEDFI